MPKSALRFCSECGAECFDPARTVCLNCAADLRVSRWVVAVGTLFYASVWALCLLAAAPVARAESVSTPPAQKQYQITMTADKIAWVEAALAKFPGPPMDATLAFLQDIERQKAEQDKVGEKKPK